MHAEALAWVAAHTPDGAAKVLDVGGRNINGTPATLPVMADTQYVIADPQGGEGVDLPIDIRVDRPPATYDVVLCLETLEHVDGWPALLAACVKATKPGGTLIVTAAGPTRKPHSKFDGAELKDGEHYANVTAEDLEDALSELDGLIVDELGADVRAVGVRKKRAATRKAKV